MNYEIHFLDDCHCKADHRLEMWEAIQRGEKVVDGLGSPLVIPKPFSAYLKELTEDLTEDVVGRIGG